MIDAIYIMRQLGVKPIEFNKQLYMRSIDTTKVFDRIRLKNVLLRYPKPKQDAHENHKTNRRPKQEKKHTC